MVRRILVIGFSFVFAASAGALLLPLLALFDPAIRDAGFEATMAGVFSVIDEAFADGAPEAAFAALGHVLWVILIATCVAPLAVAALIGELAHVRAWTWYAGATALLAAAAPWIARAAHGLDRARRISPLEGRIALLLFLTGVLTGTVYWLLAGRSAPPQDMRS
jgi:hypothetical protein